MLCYHVHSGIIIPFEGNNGGHFEIWGHLRFKNMDQVEVVNILVESQTQK